MHKAAALLACAPTPLWSSEPLPATNNNSFNVEIPSRALVAGTYRIVV